MRVISSSRHSTRMVDVGRLRCAIQEGHIRNALDSCILASSLEWRDEGVRKEVLVHYELTLLLQIRSKFHCWGCPLLRRIVDLRVLEVEFESESGS